MLISSDLKPLEGTLLTDEDLVPFVGAVHPLRVETIEVYMPEGLSLAEMLQVVQPDPVLLVDAYVFIDGYEIPRCNWHLVRPKAGHLVTARVIPVPRGGGGGKNPLRTLLTIAVLVASFAFAGPLGAGIFGTSLIEAGLAVGLTFGQGIALTGAIGGFLITAVGTILVNAIAPVRPPTLSARSDSGAGSLAQISPSLFLDGGRNQARPFDVVPQVLGFIRWRPPLAALTFTESLGDTNHLRMLLTAGYGEVEMSDFRIGNTDISEFDDVTLETRAGLVSDLPLTVYTNQVNQQNFAINMVEAEGFQQRTSAQDADELSVDLVFPRGLFRISDAGARLPVSVTIEIEFRKVGDPTFLPRPAVITSTIDLANITGSSVFIKDLRQDTIRHGIRWDTPERAQFEVRLRRVNTGFEDAQRFKDVVWTVLRTITDEDPVQFPDPIAKIGLKIRATDQLSSILDTLSVFTKSVVLDWDTGSSMWVLRASNNPASMFRHVLQGPSMANPLTDAEIDLVRLQEWHDFCVLRGFTFNMVRDFSSSALDVLNDIAAAGRAGVTMEDGKWAVVIDRPISTITTHITPRNSFGFEMEKSFDVPPEAWRMRFVNEDQDYVQDERVVPFPGFTELSATTFESLEIAGVTNPDHLFHMARYLAGVVLARPERWSVKQDFESIVAKRGSRARLTHDVIAVGLASGRVNGVTLDSGDATAIDLDEPVTMEAGKVYGVTIRRGKLTDRSLLEAVNFVLGQVSTLTFITPVSAAKIPEVGDLFGFGELGLELEEAQVLTNEPDQDFVAKVTLVPYNEAIFDTDFETSPTFVPNVSGFTPLPPVVVTDVVTDESVLIRATSGILEARADIRVDSPGDFPGVFLEVQQRPTGTTASFHNSTIMEVGENHVQVADVRTGETWDFRLRWNIELLLPSPYTMLAGVFIVGKSTPPAALTGLTISAFGNQALLRWDLPEELDVQLGGTVQFRHSSLVSGATLADSVSIGQAAQANGLFASLPLKTGTYLARTVDSIGLLGGIASVSTKQASVLTFANVASLDEDPGFTGTHAGTVSTDGLLKLAGLGLFDDIPDLDLMTVNIDEFGGVAQSGTYDFNLGFDLGSVKKVRLTTRLASLIVDTTDSIDARLDFVDSWEDWDGTPQAEGDAVVFVRTTDDDPSGSPVFTTFERLESGEFEARGFDFKIDLSISNSVFNIHVSDLGVDTEEVV